MAFQLTRLNVPSLTTDFSAETNAAAGLAKAIGGLPAEWRKQQESATQKQILGELGKDIQRGDFRSAASKAFALGDIQAGATISTLGQKAREQQREVDWLKNNAGLFGGAATGGGAAPLASLGTPNDVENAFLGAVKQAGLTNPVGLGAVAAYGRAESDFSPQNVNRTWSDPSESGKPGVSGGIMSWRGPRLEALNAFARERGEQAPTPQTQALFLAKEDPTLIPRLNAARTPQEANQIMADAWRFAGYNRPGGENARREALTAQYAQRFGVQGQPQAAPQGVQVAETEADVQRIEAQMPGYGGGPVQVAQAPAQPGGPVADMPAPDAAPAQSFAVPGATPAQTAAITADPQVRSFLRALDGAPDRFKPGIQKRLDLRIEELKQARGEETRAIDVDLKREQLAKARRDNASTAAPTTKVVKQADGSEVAVQWDPDNRRWVPLAAPEGGNAVRPAGTKLTEGQSKDLVYHTRGLQALEAFEPVANAYADGPSRVAAQIPGGNYAVSEEFQMARQAGRNFLASVLRKDTGAAVTASEEQLYGDVFLPSPGDKQGTLAQKAEARKQAIDAIRGGLGTAEVLAIGQRLVNRAPGQDAPARPARPPRAATPAPVASPQEYQALPQGTQYIAPDGSVRTKR